VVQTADDVLILKNLLFESSLAFNVRESD